MNEQQASFLLVTVGAPFLIGMAVGYFTKKTLKIGLFLLGFAIVGLFVASYYDMFHLSGPELVQTVERGTESVNRFGSFLIRSLYGLGGVGVSGGAGFFVGLKMG